MGNQLYASSYSLERAQEYLRISVFTLTLRRLNHPTRMTSLHKIVDPESAPPRGPICHFRGVDIPCLYQWSTKILIMLGILKDVLETLNHLKIYKREENKKLFLLIDRHHSRLKLPFVCYICNFHHKWEVILVFLTVYLW